MAFNFSGKVALVSGASSGIGRAIAVRLARDGASVVVCGRDTARLADVLKECREVSDGKDRFLSVQGDVVQEETRQRMIKEAVDTFHRLDILVNSAGVVDARSSIYTATPESYDRIMDTNVKSSFFLIQAALPHLEKTKGCVVNVSSFLSTVTATLGTIYPMSKSSMDHMTRCLALDLGPRGIRVNSVNPSFVPTNLWRNAEDPDTKVRKFVEVESPKHPLGSKCVTAEQVADVTAFLASETASAVTGECVPVDAGRRFGDRYRTGISS